jgi:pyruvate/oxaloacetate carboxyltransferase
MKPFGFALGALTGAAAVLLLGRPGAQRARPIAKAALKAAMMACHEARAHSAELAESAEDLFAEAKAEAAADIFAAAMAAAQAQAKSTEAKTEAKPKAETAPPQSDAPPRAAGESA